MRRSFAVHLRGAACGIRTVRERPGNEPAATARTRTPMRKRGGKGVKSPLDAASEGIYSLNEPGDVDGGKERNK